MTTRFVRIWATVVGLLLSASVAMAEGPAAPMPGQNLINWINSNITGAFPVILAVVSLFYLVKRAFAAFIGFAIFATIVAIFIYSPALISEFGKRLGQIILQ